MLSELVGALEAVTGSVAEPVQSEDLEELVGAVELAGKVSLLQVQPEQLLQRNIYRDSLTSLTSQRIIV